MCSVVADGDAHGGRFAAALVERVAGGKAGVLEGAVTFVEVEIIGSGVVGDQQVGLAIAVDVDEDVKRGRSKRWCRRRRLSR